MDWTASIVLHNIWTHKGLRHKRNGEGEGEEEGASFSSLSSQQTEEIFSFIFLKRDL